ncbi:MAG: DUF3783 domain-containing protein [Deltaproteobacteria bacterium]|nr:DUF3783 domain-containing protein [Deltaproteobacteria bacterium]MBW2117046.1 DUF3783 domain-containing protein [Deltaproteobacteria bacterium]MBW2343118.1 DUF3783 domain-containing protein [Deltaproteobacteria bacterium]
MSHEGKFKKVGKSGKKMYGHRKLLVCGYPEREQRELLSLLRENGLSDLPVIFVTSGDLQRTLKEVLDSGDRHDEGEVSGMKRAVIMSGFTQKELHALMTAYRRSELPVQLWATLTPVSENWSVADLLDELAAEAEAIKKQRK